MEQIKRGISYNDKFVCIIPARGGSKGVKRKNARLLKGKPLIGWTIEEARKSNYIDRIIVSTEDRELAALSAEYGAEVIIRPGEMAQDSSPTIEAVLYTLEELKRGNYQPGYLILLQCTSPFRTVEHIDKAIDLFIHESGRADALISVSKEEHPPWWVKEIDERGYLVDFIKYDKQRYTRRQDFPPVYRMNGAIYIIKTDVLTSLKSFQPEKTLAYEMDSFSSMDIDSERDFLIAELMSDNEVKK